MIHVYVAGPYTGDEEANVARAIAAGDILLRAGIAPYVPHLSHFWHQLHPHGYEVWMDLDFSWVQRCDALLRLPGESKGADREVSIAHEHYKPVFFMESAVIEWAEQVESLKRTFVREVSQKVDVAFKALESAAQKAYWGGDGEGKP
jgi:hypothetical protein